MKAFLSVARYAFLLAVLADSTIFSEARNSNNSLLVDPSINDQRHLQTIECCSTDGKTCVADTGCNRNKRRCIRNCSGDWITFSPAETPTPTKQPVTTTLPPIVSQIIGVLQWCHCWYPLYECSHLTSSSSHLQSAATYNSISNKDTRNSITDRSISCQLWGQLHHWANVHRRPQLRLGKDTWQRQTVSLCRCTGCSKP